MRQPAGASRCRTNTLFSHSGWGHAAFVVTNAQKKCGSRHAACQHCSIHSDASKQPLHAATAPSSPGNAKSNARHVSCQKKTHAKRACHVTHSTSAASCPVQASHTQGRVSVLNTQPNMEGRTSAPCNMILPTMGKTAANPNPRLHPLACKAFTQALAKPTPALTAKDTRNTVLHQTLHLHWLCRHPKQAPTTPLGSSPKPWKPGRELHKPARGTLPHTLGPQHHPSMLQQPQPPHPQASQAACHAGERVSNASLSRACGAPTCNKHGSPQVNMLLCLWSANAPPTARHSAPERECNPIQDPRHPKQPGHMCTQNWLCIHTLQTYNTCLKTGAARLTPAHTDVHSSRTPKAGTARTTMLRRMNSICWCM